MRRGRRGCLQVVEKWVEGGGNICGRKVDIDRKYVMIGYRWYHNVQRTLTDDITSGIKTSPFLLSCCAR